MFDRRLPDWIKKYLLPNGQNLEVRSGKYLEAKEGMWSDLNVGTGALTKAASQQPDLISLDATNVKVYAFASGSTEEVHGGVELQHNYKENTDLLPHAHVLPTTGGSGDVKIGLDYDISIRKQSSSISGTLTGTTSMPETAWDSTFCDFGKIDGSSLIVGSQINFRFYRLGGDASDTYGDDIALQTFGVHYQINTFGSRGTLEK